MLKALLYIAGALFVSTSYKYLPGIYNIRFFWVAFKYYYLKNPVENKSPFKLNIRYERCSILECDFFGFHKNNATYFTELDLCRTECFMSSLHKYFKFTKNHCYVALASITNHFLKEISPLQEYQIYSKIIGWNNKWILIINLFVIDENNKNRKITELPDYSKLDDINQNIPNSIPPLYTIDKSSKNNQSIKFKRVSCVSIGKLVFKNNRKTEEPFDIISKSLDLSDTEHLNSINSIGQNNYNQLIDCINNPIRVLDIFNSVD